MCMTTGEDTAVERKCLVFRPCFGESHEPTLAAHGVEDVVQLLEMRFLECFDMKRHSFVMVRVGE